MTDKGKGSDTDFHHQADSLLQGLFDVIDARLGDRYDVDFIDDVLNIETDDGNIFVINKSAPMRQIWLSSPVSGASHYSFQDSGSGWVSTRDDRVLLEVLAEDLAKLSGVKISL